VLLAASGAGAVVICGHLDDMAFQGVVDAALAGGCQLLALPRTVEVAGVQPHLVWRRGVPLVELTAPSLKGWQLVVKQALDFVAAAAGLVALSPVLGLVAVAIKLDSRGPVFFRQERVGRGGRVFRIYKFRTMVDGADAQREALVGQSIYTDRRLFKIPDDPRMTRLGRWLRRTSVDELPQLINVLRGEMSLVGPRPPLPSEVALYEAHHYARFDVKPGITGPWQVNGRNRLTDFERVVALEREYIRNWSLVQDLWILLRTVPAVLAGRGAH
jgi:exopolysaccharide biosynthesis polyprenyl glycosylphosphotransferase